MKLLRDIDALRAWNRHDDRTRPRVLVPTMGALHEGHLRLIDRAREHAGENGAVIVSLFVNPTQFGPDEDLDQYPRTFDADVEACEARGADAVFAPEAGDMYRGDASISVNEDRLSKVLCGASRPGHFDGVCTVVAKLFNLVEPDTAVFGQKDYQQLAIIRRLVRDLDFNIEILAEPTVREADGLAMSSRNRYLDGDQRKQAVALSAALDRTRDLLDGGERDLSGILEQARRIIAEQAPDARIDYLEAVDPETLEAIGEGDPERGVSILVAAFFGATRLIDNSLWMPHNPRP